MNGFGLSPKWEYSPKRGSLIVVYGALAALLALLVCFAQAAAHDVAPLDTEPGAGVSLGQAPTQVTLRFGEELMSGRSFVRVLNASGQAVDNGDGGVNLNDPDHASLVVSLPSDLPDGAYTVEWRVALTDGDLSEGSYEFRVGIAGRAGEPAPAAAFSPFAALQSLWPVVVAVSAALAVGLGLTLRRRARA